MMSPSTATVARASAGWKPLLVASLTAGMRAGRSCYSKGVDRASIRQGKARGFVPLMVLRQALNDSGGCKNGYEKGWKGRSPIPHRGFVASTG
ncbi:hypothetical protein SUGI_0096090 [Cryptomeria japonica]|nr:hypothetical protein SUGI_0096090 [Cryptomeria japonica]